MDTVYTKEQVIEFINVLKVETKDLAHIGTLLRDRYGVLNLAEYNLKLHKLVPYSLNYDLFTLMRKLVPLQRHLRVHSRDIHNRVQLEEYVSLIHSVIKRYKRNGKLDPSFNWSLETNERLVGRYSREAGI